MGACWRKLLVAASVIGSTALAAADPGQYFTIVVVDAETGRGVPLVELKTVNNIRLYTDSNGLVAFHEPGLMGRQVFFQVRSHGYEYPKDGFGYRGKALDVRAGGRAQLTLPRRNLAQRLYRVTGGGIYRDSLLVGQPVPIREPALNGLVLGSDSVVSAVYRDKLYWFWGDTNQPAYPLGNFHVPGATSLLPGRGGLDPEVGVDLHYFTDAKGFAKPTAPMPGPGPTWISGLIAFTEPSGQERLVAAYVKIRGYLEAYERGLVLFDDAKQQFDKLVQLRMDEPAYLDGHPFLQNVDGVPYVYFGNPYPLSRVLANLEHLKNPADYESFTCLKEGSRLTAPHLDRRGDGSICYAWKKNTPPVGAAEQARLVKEGLLRPEEGLLPLQEADSREAVRAHSGSVYWNAYRRRWLLITVESAGTSPLGEVWYAEADTPLGPWVYARKIVTHDHYSFYNPTQHPAFDKEEGRIIFFEGTYSHTFSGNAQPTPRYDYNQVLYKLDLAEARLMLPVPIYEVTNGSDIPRFVTHPGLGMPERPAHLAFFALDRPKKGSLPVYGDGNTTGRLRLGAGPASSGTGQPLFYVLPASTPQPPATATPLYEYVHADGGRYAYSTDRQASKPGFQRTPQPVCLVWRNPAGPALEALCRAENH